MPSTFVHLFAALPLPRNEQPMRYGFGLPNSSFERSQGTSCTKERRKDLNKLFADVNLSSPRPFPSPRGFDRR